MIEIRLGDCFDILPTLPAASVDLLVTDPPYMTTDLAFDKRGIDFSRFLQAAVCVVKPNGYLALFAPVEMQGEAAKVFKMRFSGAWIKTNGGMRTHSAKKPMNQWELYCVMAHPQHSVSDLTWNKIKYAGALPYRKVQRHHGYLRGGKDQLDRANTSSWTKDGFVSLNDGEREQTDVIFAPNKPCMSHAERTPHPTQKPLKTIMTLIRWLTNAGDMVLDPFSGSGTTALACQRLNRQCLCIERDPDYWRLSNDRLQNDHFQRELIFTAPESEADDYAELPN